MKILFAVLAFSLCAEVAAQEMFKCRDAAGRITYSGRECKDIGLSSAGEVKGRANVTPALETPAATPRATVRENVPTGQGSLAGEDAPATPERRCFTVKTAKGTVTRCNDTPADD